MKPNVKLPVGNKLRIQSFCLERSARVKAVCENIVSNFKVPSSRVAFC